MTTSLSAARGTTIQTESIKAVQEAVLSTPRLHVVGGRTKPALSTPTGRTVALDLTTLAGILEYDPGEYTFTALAGTSLATVEAALAEHGQYMPFDPPFSNAGATLGGTVAAGLSGPGRQRYGGVRDFLIGVRFVDGLGRLVRGGGKVVKNAAGFDLPKLMVGSLGQLGVLVELSFKVFPRPPAYATVSLTCDSASEALDAMVALATASFDIDALDMAVTDDEATLLVRIGGLPQTLTARIEGLLNLLGDGRQFSGDAEAQIWQDASDFGWVAGGATLVKTPISPARLFEFDQRLLGRGLIRRYSVGGNVAWLAWTGPINDLATLLGEAGLPGLALKGDTQGPLIGSWPGTPFYGRIKQTLDPDNRFPNYIA